MRNVLVVSEIGLAVVLVVGAGLLTRSFMGFLDWEPGFDRENLLTFQVFVPPEIYETGDRVKELYRRAEEEVRALPGVRSVATASAGPLFGGREMIGFAVGPSFPEDRQDVASARFYDVGPGYFGTLGAPLVAGRDVRESDTSGGPPVALVNETLARRHWPDESPVGRQLTIEAVLWGEPLTFEIVGVVGDVAPFVPGQRPQPEIYWSNRQFTRWASYLVVRTDGDPGPVVASIRDRLSGLEPELDVYRFRTLEQLMGRQLREPRFNMLLILGFALIAIVLTATGLYGVIAYTVALRRHEIGIRMALGADRWTVIRSVLGEGLRLLALGLPLGLAVALVASFVPAVRASRLDPGRALRVE